MKRVSQMVLLWSKSLSSIIEGSLEIIWNEKEYRNDTVKRVAIGVNPADGYTLFFWKDVTEVKQETNQFLGEEPIGKLMQKYAIPCIISLLVGALYNIVDQIFYRKRIISWLIW